MLGESSTSGLIVLVRWPGETVGCYSDYDAIARFAGRLVGSTV